MAHGIHLVLGISGGIAAYKTPSLIRLFRKNNVDVKVVCTAAAQNLVARQALSTVSGFPVYVDGGADNADLEHIELSRWADFMLVCPATANTIAKIAHGLADNLLTTCALSFENRLVVAPAMNTAMWLNKATQENLATLERRGVYVLPVDEGELACGDVGPGRCIGLETIVEFVLSLSTPKYLAGKKVLISSGPTCEPLDAVRAVTNRSTGKMGAALARAAWLAGGQVTVVSGPASFPLPAGVRVVRVTTATEMQDALEKEFDDCDICIMAAAVGDFRPAEFFDGKKHRGDGGPWNVELVPNPDIAQHLGNRKKRQFLVGFSLETDDGDAKPLEKMKRKQCDMMVVNRADQSLESDSTQVHILYPDKPADYLPLQSKQEAGQRIIERIAAHMGVSHG